MKDEIVEKSLPDLPDEDRIYDSGSWMLGNFVDGVLNTGACNIPPWWSRKRDTALRNLATSNEYLSGVLFTVQTLLYNINYQVMAKDSTIAFHNDLAQKYNEVLMWSMHDNLERFIYDLLVMDNGAFLYVDGDAPPSEPLRGMPTGLQTLDSLLCTRTRNSRYPVVYKHPDGTRHPIHRSRIIFFSQMPSNDWQMNGIGLSSVSRLNMLSTHLHDIGVYDLEKLGSLESNRILFISGAQPREIEDAVRRAEVGSNNEGLRRRGKTVYLGAREAGSKLSVVDLKTGESGSDKRTDVETTITLMAMTLGIQPYLLLESTQSSSTRGSARESIKLANSKLIAWYYKKLTSELALKFLPQSLMLSIQGKDEDVDGVKSRIYLNRALARKNNLTLEVTDERVERENMMRDGEISPIQFEQLELADNRLPNGLHISTLFYDQDPQVQSYLELDGVSDPLDFENNDADVVIKAINDKLKELITTLNKSKSMNITRKLLRAIYALQWLENEYQKQTPDELDVVEPVDTGDPSTEAPIDETGDQDMDNFNMQSENPRDLANENNIQEKSNKDDWLYLVLSGEKDEDFEYNFTKVSDRRFTKAVREPVRGLWSGELTKEEFLDTVPDTLKTNVARVYVDTVKAESGKDVQVGDVNSLDELYDRIDTYVEGFADYIVKNKKGDGKLKDVYSRADLWIELKYETEELAKLDDNIDDEIEYVWRLGHTNESCGTCLGNSNVVKTKAEWDREGVYPRSRDLECKGYKCQCTLEKMK